MKNTLKSHIFSNSQSLLKTAALSLLLTFSACNQKGETTVATPETNDSLKKIGRYYDDKGKKFYDNDQGDSALQNYVTAIKYYEQTDEIKNKRGATKDIGKIKYKAGEYDEALLYFQKALEILKDTDYVRGELITKVNIAAVYNEQGAGNPKNYDMALEKYLLPGLEILKKENSTDPKQINLMVQYLVEIGNAYFKKKAYDPATIHRNEAKVLTDQIKQKQNNIAFYYNFGDMKQEQGKYDEVVENYEQGISLSRTAKKLTQERNGCEKMYFFYKNHTENSDSTLKYHELRTELKDSISSIESKKFQKEMETKYESEKKDKEIKLQTAAKETQESITLIVLIAGILIVVIVTYGLRMTRKKNKELGEKNTEITQQNEEITAQRDEIEAQRDELAESNKIIEEQHREITDSINYAKNIQKAVLPPLEEIEEIFPQSFILFKPKDVVSGDFYRAAKNNKNKRFIAAPDCTGHGVPGAFMSILNCDSMDDAVNREEAKTAADILNYVNIDLPKKFHQEHKESEEGKRKDTMDVALCAIDENNMIEFALAKNPAILIRNGECFEFKEEKHAIGSGEYTYKNQTFPGEKGDMIYLFSDGFEDQFGGPKGKKFLVKNLKELFKTIAHLPMEEQKNHLEQTMESRKGNLEQVDDILVIGFRI